MRQLVLTLLALGGMGGALIVAGIYLIAGLPWSLIAAGMFFFLAAWLLRSGMMPNG